MCYKSLSPKANAPITPSVKLKNIAETTMVTMVSDDSSGVDTTRNNMATVVPRIGIMDAAIDKTPILPNRFLRSVIGLLSFKFSTFTAIASRGTGQFQHGQCAGGK